MESPRSRILWLVVLPLLSAAAIAWWLQGEQVEMFGTDKNFSLPIAESNATTIGVLGVVVGGLVLVQFARHRTKLGGGIFLLVGLPILSIATAAVAIRAIRTPTI